MNVTDLEGKWEQVKGFVKQQWGDFTDDDLLEIEGQVERLKGKLREKYGMTWKEIEDEVRIFLSNYSLPDK